jgi:F1F0 ATPase subunit 2
MSSVSILFRLSAGIGLGVFFYTGLWLTVRTLPTTRHPALLTLCSFWIRTLIVVATVFLLIDKRWGNALVCIAGFLVGRLIVSVSINAPAERAKCP